MDVSGSAHNNRQHTSAVKNTMTLFTIPSRKSNCPVLYQWNGEIRK